MGFAEKVQSLQGAPLTASCIDMLQVNLGYLCNLSCRHCHVQGGPERIEIMDAATVSAVVDVLRQGDIGTVDLTGGAPELNPHFRHLIAEATSAGCHVVVRTNLAVFFEAGMDDLGELYAGRQVEVVASLPYYRGDNVDRVRGAGVFLKSIEALRRLNALGYGRGSGLKLNLVHNPAGAFLPPDQATLEAEYRKHLHANFGVAFDSLYAFANMPIGRYRQYLISSGNFERYMQKLRDAFNPETLCGLMCRRLVNVGWDGRLYDCDFNQMAGLGIADGRPGHIRDFSVDRLASRKIAVDDHCFGCTAGQGST